MGTPEPVQDDPRLSAVDRADLPPSPWNDAQTAEATANGQAWQLLLQVSIADLSQRQTEGTVTSWSARTTSRAAISHA